MDIFNASDIMGQIFISGNNTIFGNMVLALLYVFIFLLAISILFGIPFEFTIVLLLPYTIAVASYYGSFYAVLISLLLYVSVIIARNFIFR